MEMDQDAIDAIKALGVGCRHPKDEFFKEGNEINKIRKIFGVYEVDDEAFCHKSYPNFSCHVPGCNTSCETVNEYEQHYNSCHRFSCSVCNKYLPTSHLLDLHIAEVHDAYFAALAEKKPMYQCYLQECKEVFQSPGLRKDHCIKNHKFPSDFRFDITKKKKSGKKPGGKVKKEASADSGEMGDADEGSEKMEVSQEGQECKGKKSCKGQNIHFGYTRRPRKMVLQSFVKDMKDSLPS